MHAAQRAGPGCRCSPARPTAPPAAAATWPHASAARRPRPRVSPFHLQPLPPGPTRQPHSSTVLSSSPTPQPPTRPAPYSGGRAGQGVTPGAWPCLSLAPRLRHRTRAIGCHRTRLHRSIAVRHGGMELGYKARSSVALALVPLPAATWWPTTSH